MKGKIYTMKKSFHKIEENIKRIRDDISAAAFEAGRNESEIRLMAVTKTVEPERINRALGCGIDLIGENRVQEMLAKLPLIALGGVEKHLIGHLQTNKVSQIIGAVDMIQSVDSLRLASEISKHAGRLGINMRVLIEVNIGREESKSGFLPEALTENLYEISEMRNIIVCGLMAIPPICEKNSEIRAFFYDMRKLFIDIQGKKMDNIEMSILSMGMSGDYREAILEGSTMIRVGSSIFGYRKEEEK